ncbi:MAG: ABC transporter ATP-binding protein, partial [Oribacterium parvum]|nr:ABC transporter ATP-binding protein [Oribacterium parvum]
GMILKNGRIAATESVEEIHRQGKTIEEFYREKVEKEA